MKKLVFALLLISTSVAAQTEDGEVEAPLQQQNVNTDEQTKTKLGVKFTMGGHTFLGNAFENQRPLYGFGSGIYNIVDLNKAKNLKLHWELNITFKGSKFDKPNDTSYSKISLAYLDLPVMLSVRLFPTGTNRYFHLLAGGQFSWLFRSTINKSYGQYGTVKTNLPFERIDVAPVLGFRMEVGSGMAAQLCVKPGLLNNYTNRFWERSQADHPEKDDFNTDYRDLTPRFRDGTHQNRNFSIELSFMF